MSKGRGVDDELTQRCLNKYEHNLHVALVTSTEWMSFYDNQRCFKHQSSTCHYRGPSEPTRNVGCFFQFGLFNYIYKHFESSLVNIPIVLLSSRNAENAAEPLAPIISMVYYLNFHFYRINTEKISNLSWNLKYVHIYHRLVPAGKSCEELLWTLVKCRSTLYILQTDTPAPQIRLILWLCPLTKKWTAYTFHGSSS